jgi:hypothetical protein
MNLAGVYARAHMGVRIDCHRDWLGHGDRIPSGDPGSPLLCASARDTGGPICPCRQSTRWQQLSREQPDDHAVPHSTSSLEARRLQPNVIPCTATDHCPRTGGLAIGILDPVRSVDEVRQPVASWWRLQLLLSEQRRRHATRRSPTGTMMMVILFQQLGYRAFKALYLQQVRGHPRDDFRRLVGPGALSSCCCARWFR